MSSLILTFLQTYWLDIVIAVVVLGVAIFLYVKGYNKKFLNHIVLALVVEAEQKLGGGGTGEFKFSDVMSQLYAKLPIIVRLFVSQKYLEDLIETNVNDLREFLKNGGDISDYQVKLMGNMGFISSETLFDDEDRKEYKDEEIE